MGGDDLGSDDDYLLDSRQFDDDDADDADAGRADPGSRAGDVGKSSPSGRIGGGGGGGGNKRRLDSGVAGAPPPSSTTADVDTKSKKKRRRRKNKKKGTDDASSLTGGELLIEAGRTISAKPAHVQAAFLWTCYSHALGLIRGAAGEGGGDGDGDGDGDDAAEGEKFRPSSFVVRSSSASASGDADMPPFVRSSVSSVKKLKNWKSPPGVAYSPMVLVICISARRSVAVLKALSPLKVRCAKLFAKHMDFDAQVGMLTGDDASSSSSSSVGAVAVGTPNRLLKLCEAGALCLDRTELVLIDCRPDSKGFTVCTLNDTAPDLMRFIRSYVRPQMGSGDSGAATKKSKGNGSGRTRDIKFAMF